MPRPPLRLGRLSVLLLLILREAPAPAAFIAFHLGLDRPKVSMYLSRLKRLGLATYDSYGVWYLTEEGRRYIEALITSSENLKNIKEHLLRVESATLIDSNATLMRSNATVIRTYATLMRKAERLLGRPLDDVERAILEYLADFKSLAGREYWWPPEPVPLHLALAEELERRGISSISSSDVERALRELESAGVLFMTFDRSRGVAKVRISKGLFSQ